MLERDTEGFMINIDIFIKHFKNEYPNEEQYVFEINEHISQDQYWVKIIYKDPESKELSLKTNTELFSFSNVLAKSIGYSGVIVGAMQPSLELYMCGDTETRWVEPVLLGTYGTSGGYGMTGMTYISGVTTTMTTIPVINDESEEDTVEEVQMEPIILPRRRNNVKWYHKFIKNMGKYGR
jgi:hypothetical protein